MMGRSLVSPCAQRADRSLDHEARLDSGGDARSAGCGKYDGREQSLKAMRLRRAHGQVLELDVRASAHASSKARVDDVGCCIHVDELARF